MRKKALIIGIGGQDGSLLADLLVRKNYIVSGTAKKINKFSLFRLNELNIIKDIPVYNNDERKIDKIEKNCYCDQNYYKNIYDDSIGGLDNDNILLDGDSFLVNFYGGLLDDIKNVKPIKDNQLSFPI